MFHRKKMFQEANSVLTFFPLLSLTLIFHLSVFTRPGGCLSLHTIPKQPLLSYSHTSGHPTPPAVTPTTAATAATTNTDRCSTGKMLLLPFPYTWRRYNSIENAAIDFTFSGSLTIICSPPREQIFSTTLFISLW